VAHGEADARPSPSARSRRGVAALLTEDEERKIAAWKEAVSVFYGGPAPANRGWEPHEDDLWWHEEAVHLSLELLNKTLLKDQVDDDDDDLMMMMMFRSLPRTVHHP
jgi:hypothetical protein